MLRAGSATFLHPLQECAPWGDQAMSHDTWIHRISRIVAVPLARTPVTPNQVTTARLLTGIAAAGAFALGEGAWLTVGGGIFVVSMVLDRADGVLARMTGRASPWGHKYDLIADAVCNALAFIGLGIGLHGDALDPWAVPMGFVAGTAIVTILWMVMRIESVNGARAAELGGKAGFDLDDAMLLVPIAVWLGLPVPLLIAASIGAPLFALLFGWRFRRALSRAPA